MTSTNTDTSKLPHPPERWLSPADPLPESDLEEASGVVTKTSQARTDNPSKTNWLTRAARVFVTLVVGPWILYIGGLVLLVSFPLLPFIGFAAAAWLGGGSRVRRSTRPPLGVGRSPRRVHSHLELPRAA